MPDDLKFTDYYHSNKRDHPEVKDEWVEYVLSNPYRCEIQPKDGRMRYWRYIPEMKRWLRVIVKGGIVHNAFFDRGKLKEWGIPNEAE